MKKLLQTEYTIRFKENTKTSHAKSFIMLTIHKSTLKNEVKRHMNPSI